VETPVPYYLEPMQLEDVAEVNQVEKECFPTPWPTSAYRRELRNPAGNYYIVARWRPGEDGAPHSAQSPDNNHRAPFGLFSFLQRTPPPPPHPHRLVGFAGMWTVMDEAHITTIGVAVAHRGRHIGELLLVGLIDEAMHRNANWITLEVRVSNLTAQNLYRKYGFSQYGVRKRYYSDNGEDAYIMWSPSLRAPEFRARLTLLKQELAENLARWETRVPGLVGQPELRSSDPQ
jgi:ribosomal-protein-alanine N-acetyltransferase